MTEFQDATRDAVAAITMHKIAVERTARYATAGADPADTTTLWVVFHGYGQLASEFVFVAHSLIQHLWPKQPPAIRKQGF